MATTGATGGDLATSRRRPSGAVRRLATETKQAFKTSEFWAMLGLVVAILVSAAVINGGDNGTDEFIARQAWLYVAILGGALLHLARAGQVGNGASRTPTMPATPATVPTGAETEPTSDVRRSGGSAVDSQVRGRAARGDAGLRRRKGMPESTQTISSEGGNGAAENTQDKAREVASQAQDKAREAAGEVRGRVRDQVDQRSTQFGEQIRSGAGDARAVAEQLRDQGKQAPARYVEQAADRAERLGGYLRESDGDRLLNDVEDFARRNTWAMALGGLALGFAASRLLKASSSDRYRSSVQSSSRGVSSTGGQSTSAATPNRGDVASPGPAGEPAAGLVPTPAPAPGSRE